MQTCDRIASYGSQSIVSFLRNIFYSFVEFYNALLGRQGHILTFRKLSRSGECGTGYFSFLSAPGANLYPSLQKARGVEPLPPDDGPFRRF